MKKITFILFALITGTTFAQDAIGTSQVHAEIVSPIEIVSTGNLNFGTIAAGTDAGKVRVSNDGTRTFSDPGMKVLSSGTAASAASFEITAASDYSYSIAIPATTLSNEVENMDIEFTQSLPVSGTVGTGTAQILNVGGLLSVNGGQAEGEYEGTVTVTISYE